MDPPFLHRCLRCLVVVDLKHGKFTLAGAGQMHLYLSYAKAHWTHADENPPVGLILCSSVGENIVRYTSTRCPAKSSPARIASRCPIKTSRAGVSEHSKKLAPSKP